jgi:hypothetical protein
VINGFEVTIFNLFIALQIPDYLLKIFLFIAALVFSLTSLFVIVRHGFKKGLIIQSLIFLTISVLIAIPEIKKNQDYRLFQKTANESLSAYEFAELFIKATEKENISALSNLARNKSLPDSIEIKLSHSKYPDVRQVVAWSTDSKDILIKLSEDDYSKVRAAVATNKLTPIEIVGSLQNDENEIVRNTAFAMIKARQ